MLPPSEQLAELAMNVAEIIPADGLAKQLGKDRPLRIKLGFDPTRPDLHIGHAVVLRKIRQFQDLGHQIIIIIGDFTAQIGDPTGKEATRPPLTVAEVAVNAQTYCDQLWKILDQGKTTVRFNSEWLNPLTLADTIKLMGKFTVAQMLARENFQNRFKKNEPIALHEFLYPILQAYDSVEIKADVELGGTDQTFNLLVGRELQQIYSQAPQAVLVMPILVGLDGVQKMSKSLDNYIGLTDTPKDMFGKMMSIADAQLDEYARLAANRPVAAVQESLAALKAGTLHPMDFKKGLARDVVALYHGDAAGAEALAAFEATHQKREMPSLESMEQFELVIDGSPISGAVLLADVTGFAASRGEAKRLIDGGGVKLNEDKLTSPGEDLRERLQAKPEGSVLQVGRRKFAFIKPILR